jgi:hypothetical protein
VWGQLDLEIHLEEFALVASVGVVEHSLEIDLLTSPRAVPFHLRQMLMHVEGQMAASLTAGQVEVAAHVGGVDGLALMSTTPTVSQAASLIGADVASPKLKPVLTQCVGSSTQW